jgi:hypothetical protein
MVDYYPLISRAIAGLDKKSSEARRAVYDRARAALADQLQKVDPPFAFEHERLALEDAISKVEADTISGEGTRPTPEVHKLKVMNQDLLLKTSNGRVVRAKMLPRSALVRSTLARWFLALCFG